MDPGLLTASMRNKPVILTLASFILMASLCAQTSLGVEGGLSYNSYHTNISNRAATDLAGKLGFSISAAVRYRLYSWLFVVARPGVIQKSYSLNRTDSLSGEYDQHNNTYLQLPIGVSLTHDWRRVRIGLDMGLYAGYWLYGRVKGNTADVFGNSGSNNSQQFMLTPYDAGYSFDSRRDDRWEEGWWLGPALQYRLRRSWCLTAGARYYGALTSAVKAPVSPIPAYNRTAEFSVGAAWSIPDSKSHRR